MKRKLMTKPDWPRIAKRHSKLIYVENSDFNGHIAALYLDKVNEPLIVKQRERSVCIVDDGYLWLVFLPNNEYYALTTLYNAQGEIIEWYFDITNQNGVDEEGCPFFDDLYLDVVVTPSSKVTLLDEDELDDALESKMITIEQYKFAHAKAKDIMEGIARDKLSLIKFSTKYLNYIENHDSSLLENSES